MDFLTFLQQLINGLSLGSLYALIAIGYTMVYGILRLINFAHGDLLMVAAYAAVMGVGLFAWPWPVAFGLAIALTGLLGVLLERGAYRPLRRAPRISLLISAIAASFLLENLALVIAGGRAKPFPVPEAFNGAIVLGGLYIPRLSFLIPLATAVFLAGLFYIVYRTQLGRAMRAIALDLEMTGLMGIDVNRIIAFTFLLGSLLAGAGGVLWAMKYPQVNPFMGILPGLKAFIAAVLGGIGNVTGAVLGGLLLGMLEIMIVAWLPAWAGYRDALAFALLIVLLLTRPTGLLGEALGEEKL
ncbi:MAG: branched-chain amino acid ABC transporter permease [Desulfobaccales bacterium]